VLLALGGCAAASDHHDMLRAIARVMLDGVLPDTAQSLDTAVRGVDIAIAALPPAVQGEIGQLFGLLEFPMTRRLLAGVGPWSHATDGEIAAFLQSWRTSNTALFRSGYAALHQLVMAGWYGNERAWPGIGYPGPPHFA
jgi:hypothetical protein